MAQISVDISTLGIRQIPPTIDRIVSNLKEPMGAAGMYVLEQVSNHFRSKTGNDGPWAPLSKATVARRRKGKGSGSAQILRDTGRLMQSVTPAQAEGNIFQLEDMSVTVGTNITYAAIHQFGGVIQRQPAAMTLRHRTNAAGELLRQQGYKNLAVFAKKSHSRARVTEVQRKAYSITIKARPYLWLTEKDEECIGDIFNKWIGKKMKEELE